MIPVDSVNAVLKFIGLQLHFSQEQIGNEVIELIQFKGRIDNQNANQLNRKIHILLQKQNITLIIGLGELDYINSIGMAILFSIFHRQKESKKRIVIGGLNPFLRELFQLVHLPAEVVVTNTIEEAKKLLARQLRGKSR